MKFSLFFKQSAKLFLKTFLIFRLKRFPLLQVICSLMQSKLASPSSLISDSMAGQINIRSCILEFRFKIDVITICWTANYFLSLQLRLNNPTVLGTIRHRGLVHGWGHLHLYSLLSRNNMNDKRYDKPGFKMEIYACSIMTICGTKNGHTLMNANWKQWFHHSNNMPGNRRWCSWDSPYNPSECFDYALWHGVRALYNTMTTLNTSIQLCFHHVFCLMVC